LSIQRLLATIAVGIAAAGTIVIAWIWVAPCALGGCAPLDQLAEYQAEGSELLDAHGEPFARLATVNRRIVSIDSLPPHLPQAFIAIEDQRFYRHGGIDLWRTAGALVRNVRAGTVAEGGSTITQQLARNLFPEWLPFQQRNLRRKLLEARVARQIERTFTKDKILELYLNHIYLGSGAYGIEAASQTYFGKPAAELDLVEAATLAGLPQAPSRINPLEDMERATRRRDVVLEQMAEAGYLTPQAAAAAKAEPISLRGGAERNDGPAAAYFVERVRRELEETVGSRFYTAGLRIHTTYDPAAQEAAEEELERQLRAIEGGSFGAYRHPAYAGREGEARSSRYLQGAVVVLDARSGEVRALVGGRDFVDSKFDRATQALRQPGSAFKPFIYASALERHRTPAHLVEDAPLSLTLAGGRVWEPRNYTGQYDGMITMRDALARSKNTATVRLAQEVGLRSPIHVAQALGITSEIPDLPATALGAADVRPIELVAAFAGFANGGERIEPHLIRRVADRSGRTLWEARPRRSRALDPAVAFVLTTMLQDVVDRGTGSAVRAVGFRTAAAGKTGTTNEASDVWFVGYTPELAAVVWIGLDQPQTIVRGASGGTLAAPVWGRMMRRIYASRPDPGQWRMPSGVVTAEVDRATGAVVSPECPPQGATYTEYFIGSAPPSQLCSTSEYDPRYTLGDTAWIDEEWGDVEVGEPRFDLPPGIDWPELEALRRRIERAREEAERVGSGTDAAADPAARRPPGTPPGEPPLPGEPLPQPEQPPRTPPPATPAPAEPGPEPEPPTQPSPQPPRLLGEPARPGGGPDAGEAAG
jgi:1A family penicillin-binding protein